MILQWTIRCKASGFFVFLIYFFILSNVTGQRNTSEPNNKKTKIILEIKNKMLTFVSENKI